MPFLAAAAPFLAKAAPAIIGAGGGIASAFIGKKGSDNATSALNRANVTAQQAQQESLRMGKGVYEQATQAGQKVSPLLQQLELFYNKIVSGDPSVMAQVMAPQLNQMGLQADAARRNIQANLSRGGAREMALAETYRGQGRQIADLYAQTHMQGWQGLAGLANIHGQREMGLYQTASGFLGPTQAPRPQPGPSASASAWGQAAQATGGAFMDWWRNRQGYGVPPPTDPSPYVPPLPRTAPAPPPSLVPNPKYRP